MWLLQISCAWVAGVFLGSKVSLPWFTLFPGLIPLMLIPFLPSSKKVLIVATLCLFALIGGALRFTSSLPAGEESCLCFYNDKGEMEIEGVVAEQPDVRGNYTLLTLSALKAIMHGEAKEVSGAALVRVPRYPAYRYGDVLRITGEPGSPYRSEEFDYKRYLEREAIYSVIYYPEVELLDRGQGSKPWQWIYSLRERLSVSLARALPEPQCSLAQGILLGLRSNIPESLRQAFSRTGTAHLLAISGVHLSVIIAMFLSLGILILGRQRSIHVWLTLGALWFYAMLAGMGPPLIRAAIMGSSFLLAEFFGRQRSGIIALTFAAALMVGIEPGVLWTVSFQLSFLAMAGLVLFYPRFQELGRRATQSLAGDKVTASAIGAMMTDGFAAALAATIMVAPVIAYHFDFVSLVGIPATLFSLPALPPVIVITALVALTGLLAPVIAQVMGWLAWLFLSYLVLLVKGFDALPHSSLPVSAASAPYVWAYYLGLAGLIGCINYRRDLNDLVTRMMWRTKSVLTAIPRARFRFSLKWLVPPLLLIAIFLWFLVLNLPDDRLHVTFFDVGQGDAILIQTPCGQDVLIDGGPDTQKLNLELSKKLPFWDHTIDLVVCTQPQADHVTGLIDVVQRYKVGEILQSEIGYNTSLYQEWCRVTAEKQMPRLKAEAGQRIDLGDGVIMEVLNPPTKPLRFTSDDVDNNGVVLRLSWKEVSFLFAADIREEAELELVRQGIALQATVLKVAHHGSRTSTSAQFLSAVDPEVAVISAGKGNPFGHPHAEVVERLNARVGEDNVYCTIDRGTIEFITDGQRLWVRTGV